eukprot:1124357-Rhodomonas_salina.1
MCRLELPATYQHSRLHESFNFDLLKKFVSRPAHLGGEPAPQDPAELLNDDDDPHISALENWVHLGDGFYFLVRWSTSPSSET